MADPSTASSVKEPKLLDRVRAAARVRHLSLRTEKTYVQWIRRYILFHGKRHPAEMGEAEINAFLTHLAVEGKVSASTQTQALCAILFLYRAVLGRDVGELEGLIRARRRRKLPVVLTQDEVKRILAVAGGVERLFLSLLYGTGMRLAEVLRLRVKDVDFIYDQIAEREDDDDLHPRAQPGRPWRAEPDRPPVVGFALAAYTTDSQSHKSSRMHLRRKRNPKKPKRIPSVWSARRQAYRPSGGQITFRRPRGKTLIGAP